MHRLPRLLALLLIAATGVTSLSAQNGQNEFDSRGRLFWVTFIEGRGGLGVTEEPGMRLYVSAVEPTTARITDNRSGRQIDIPIPQANRSYEVDVTALFGGNFELGGENLGFSRKSLRVEADVDMTLYGVTTRLFSSDGFLALPDDVLTGRYVLLSYPNGFRLADPFGGGGYDHPSEFAVVATRDQTSVDIEPSVPVNGRPTASPISVTLDAGDVYFVQANLDDAYDVTGTTVRASEPVAVFSGNRRTSIPTTVGNFRDLLVEQMPPLDSWGESVIISPFVITDGFDFGYDPVARIVAVDDETRWRRNGVEQAPLSAGVPVEFVLGEEPEHIEADGPVLIAQYEHSVNEIQPDVFGLGDPFMAILPPITQYDTAYFFQSVPDTLFERHLVNVVIPTSHITTLRIDGQPVVAQYRPVPNTPYSYAQIDLLAGSHRVEADAPFGLLCYGYGIANSYGYPGGMLFRPIVGDSRLPRLSGELDCSTFRGIAVDDRITDDGVDSVELVPSKSSNVRLTVDPFNSGADSVDWQVDLVDPYRDGVLVVRAKDSAGWAQEFRRDIPGYTVGVGQGGAATPTTVRAPAYNGEESCISIPISNYGRFPQLVTGLEHDGGPEFSIRTQLPIALDPGDVDSIVVCFSSIDTGRFEIGLTLGDGCRDRNVAAVEFVAISDVDPPRFSTDGSGCEPPVSGSVTFSEPESEFFGITEIELVEITNGRLRGIDPGTYPTGSARVDVEQIDPYIETTYRLRVLDRAGNDLLFSDTLGAFTARAYTADRSTQVGVRIDVAWQTGEVNYRSDRCDTLLLVNEGSRPIEIDRAHLLENLDISIPPSQFPLQIEAGETRKLAICLEGLRAGERLDTLLLVDACGRSDRVAIKADVLFGAGSGVDRCGQRLRVQAFDAARRTFLEPPFPSPSTAEQVGLHIGLDRESAVTIDLLDATGNRRLRLLSAEVLPAGLHRLDFVPGQLESGTYFCRMTTDAGELITAPLIVRQ